MRISNKLRHRRKDVLTRENVVKIGRNEPCPCGSGAKYKRCCEAAPGLSGWWRRFKARRAVKRNQKLRDDNVRGDTP